MDIPLANYCIFIFFIRIQYPTILQNVNLNDKIYLTVKIYFTAGEYLYGHPYPLPHPGPRDA